MGKQLENIRSHDDGFKQQEDHDYIDADIIEDEIQSRPAPMSDNDLIKIDNAIEVVTMKSHSDSAPVIAIIFITVFVFMLLIATA